MRQVGLADRIRAYAQGGASSSGAPAAAAPERQNVSLTFKLREFDTSADDGTPIYGRGWVVRDEHGQALSDHDELLDDCGALIFKVAVVTFRPAALRLSCFNPGNHVKLVKEPTNPVDANAIAVWDHSQRHHLGYVPATRTWRIRIGLDGNPNAHAYIWWDWHKSDGKRCGIKAVLLPHPTTFTAFPDWKAQ